MVKKSKFSLVFASGLVMLSTACAPKSSTSLESVASDTKNAVGCSDFESRTWDAINRYLIEEKSVPSFEDLKEHLKSSLKDLRAPVDPLSDEKLEILAKDFDELFEILLVEAPQLENVDNAAGLLKVLSALELGDHTTPNKVRLQSRVQTQFAKIQNHVNSMNVQCTEPAPAPEEPVETEKIPTKLPLPVYGIRFTFATAYQSCQALNEPIMSSSTVDIEEAAIKITGKHPDGVGNRRVIANVDALLRSHPYYKNVNNYQSSCLKGHDYPMIYDYGGKPFATTGLTSSLNFFKNGGDGTSALGTDCSGLVYTALATAGLRLSPGKSMKASGVNGISSTMYVEPQKNGLSCLEKITLTPSTTLKAGDIVAVKGHVLMVDSVGADPFGLNGIKTAEECSKIEAKNFDFVVIQSSPSKNAVGMNRYQARDYLYESEKMLDGLVKYAQQACLARVNNKNYKPDLGTLSVIRHKLTSSCQGSRIKLAQESCIKSCPELAN